MKSWRLPVIQISLFLTVFFCAEVVLHSNVVIKKYQFELTSGTGTNATADSPESETKYEDQISQSVTEGSLPQPSLSLATPGKPFPASSFFWNVWQPPRIS
jgi:hypothetical protein